MKRALFLLAGVAASFGLACSARADEIWLKDGSKIAGTIIGYESDSFKVATTYGFAFVRKNSILEILPGDAKAVAAKVPPAKPDEAPPPALTVAAQPAPVRPQPLAPLPAMQPAETPAERVGGAAGVLCHSPPHACAAHDTRDP